MKSLLALYRFPPEALPLPRRRGGEAPAYCDVRIPSLILWLGLFPCLFYPYLSVLLIVPCVWIRLRLPSSERRGGQCVPPRGNSLLTYVATASLLVLLYWGLTLALVYGLPILLQALGLVDRPHTASEAKAQGMALKHHQNSLLHLFRLAYTFYLSGQATLFLHLECWASPIHRQTLALLAWPSVPDARTCIDKEDVDD